MGKQSADNFRAAIRAHQERVLIERGRLCLLGTIAGVLVLWGLGVSHLLAHTGSSVPLLNSVELCILTAALTQVRRPWPRRHVIGLSTAMCVQLAAFMALYALWTGSLWLFSLRMTTLNLVTAAVLPWGVVAQGVVMLTSTLALALVHWSLNGTLDHPSTFPTLVLFVFSLPLALLLKQAHAQLASEIERRQTAESALRRATESAGVAVWSCDLTKFTVRFSSGWKRVLGRDENEITLAALWDLVHPDDRPKTTAAMQEHFQGRAAVYDAEQRMLHADGSYRWVLSRGLVAYDAAGRPSGLLGADIDITEHKQLQEALRRSEEKYRQLVEDIGEAIYAVDATGTVTYVSPIAESMYGYAPAEIVNRPFTDFVPAEDVARLMQGFAAALSGTPDLRDHRIVTKAGDIRWVRNSARGVTEGRGIGLRGVLTDVTERRRIEHELRTLTDELDMRVIERTRQLSEALDQLRLQGAALEAAPDAVAISDHQGHIQWINPAFTRLTGYDAEEVVGQTFLILQSDQHDSTFYQHLLAKAAAGEIYRSEIVDRRKDGSLFAAELVIAPVRNRHGAITHHVVIQCDNSARKRAEQALRQQSHRNQLLLQTASDGIHILDVQGRVVEVNAAFCAMLGYSAEELAHMWVGDWDAQWNEQELRARLSSLLGQPAVFESTHRRKDGTTIDVEISATAVDIDGETLLYASARDITQRKRVQEALRRSEERFALAVAGTNDGIWDLDYKTGKLYVSSRVKSIQGLEGTELPNRRDEWLSRVHPEDTERVEAAIRAHLTGSTPRFESEYRIRHEDGSYRWVLSRALAVRDALGNPDRIVGSITDITERKRAEQRAAALLHITTQIAGTLDTAALLDGVQRRVAGVLPCDAVVTLLLDPASEMLRVASHSGIPPDWRATVSGLEFRPGQFGDDIASGQPLVINDFANPGMLAELAGQIPISALAAVTLRVRGHYFGRLCAARVQGGAPFTAPDIELLSGIAQQLAIGLETSQLYEAQRQEATVSGALARLGRELIANLNTPRLLDRLCQLTTEILHCDVSSTFFRDLEKREWSGAATFGNTEEFWESLHAMKLSEAVFAREIEQLAHEGILQFQPTDFARMPVPATALVLQSGVALVVYIALWRGEQLVGVQTAAWYHHTGGLDYDEERIARGIGQMASIALDHVRIVGELERANHLKSDFMATMSHELRTPLNIIMGYNGLLLDGTFGSLNPDQADSVQRTQKQAEELLELIEATLNVSRLETDHSPLHPEEIDVGNLVGALAAETIPRYDKPTVATVCDVSPQLPRIHTDAAKLKLVVKNLLSNAKKFTAEGRVTVSACQRDSGVEITVSDTGIGIRPDMLPVIFEPFRQGESGPTSEYGGVGLGLYIVRRLVDLLAGTVNVDSEVGRGSAFHVWLPLEVKVPTEPHDKRDGA